MNGGTIDSKATGSNYGSSGGGGGGWGGGSSTSSSVSAKGIKADGAAVFNGGETHATSSSHEAFETKSTLTVNDSSNDGIDSNGNMYISGGVVLAFGSGSPECGLDAAERYYLYITGGTVIANGGGNNSVTSTTGSQPLIGVSTSLSKFAIETTSSTGSSSIFAFDATQLPNGYTTSSGGGGGGGGWGGHGPGGGGGGGGGTSSWLISSPSFSTGSTYYIYSSPNITETDDTWYGLTLGAKVSGGSQTTSAKATTTYSGR